jgi:hypothetical protein
MRWISMRTLHDHTVHDDTSIHNLPYLSSEPLESIVPDKKQVQQMLAQHTSYNSPRNLVNHALFSTYGSRIVHNC